jgi:AraC-like DNA-binding protein
MLQAGADISAVSTQISHMAIVERVIHTMREHLREPLLLEDMADIACLSPYYFSRVFHSVVGIPPGEFLATLRLEAAKRLLLTTTLSVTDVCFEVGYIGLGSFTTRFTQMVGVPPRHLRHLAKEVPVPIHSLQPEPTIAAQAPYGYTLSGHIHTIEEFHGVIFAGLFPKPIPQGRAVRCTLLTQPGPFLIDRIPAGRYFLMVAALPLVEEAQVYLLPGERLLVGIQGPLLIGPHRYANSSIECKTVMSDSTTLLEESVEIVLRPLRSTDPPIITALPYVSRLGQA